MRELSDLNNFFFFLQPKISTKFINLNNVFRNKGCIFSGPDPSFWKSLPVFPEFLPPGFPHGSQECQLLPDGASLDDNPVQPQADHVCA